MSRSRTGIVEVAGARLEYAWSGPGPDEAPTLVFLHEGLGCVSLWRDLPIRLSETTGLGAFVYSRQGYGNSDPAELPRPPDFMDREAGVVLPDVLGAAGIRRYFLIGHSDGASISLIFAANRTTARDGLLGLCLEAPHVFVEDVTVQSIAAIGESYHDGALRQRLTRHHGSNVDTAFWGWNRVWLDPRFRDWNITRTLDAIDVPVQVLQGRNDEYGTLAQIAAIEDGVSGPFQKKLFEQSGHSPHRDQPDAVLSDMAQFIAHYSADLDGSAA